MMDKEIQDAINEQIRAELYSAYLYLAMSAHFAERNFDGFAQWMRLQAQEEVGHAMRFFDYVLRRGGHVELHTVEAPTADFGSPADIFAAALEHEKKVTAMIRSIYELARRREDFATEQKLQWFIAEQVEEEESAGRAAEQLKMAGDNMAALLMLDQRFGAREAEAGQETAGDGRA
ncbi:MAG: ferritin [Gemmatimonadota bacterium]